MYINTKDGFKWNDKQSHYLVNEKYKRAPANGKIALVITATKALGAAINSL